MHSPSANQAFDELQTYFITWTTYGSWLPGDARGWRKNNAWTQPPNQRLESWCQNQMHETEVNLNISQRKKVEAICRLHVELRGWEIHALSVRSNHVHLALSANANPKLVRDQLKANATQILRKHPFAIHNKKIWTRGGDIEFIKNETELEHVVDYILFAQDRKERDS